MTSSPRSSRLHSLLAVLCALGLVFALPAFATGEDAEPSAKAKKEAADRAKDSGKAKEAKPEEEKKESTEAPVGTIEDIYAATEEPATEDTATEAVAQEDPFLAALPKKSEGDEPEKK